MFGDSDADGQPEVLQEDHYYPFGLKMADGGLQPSQANVFLYNGKELQNELGLGWYDYGARMLNPTIGRWNGVDALAENSISHTPFCYVVNNPLIFIDPDGNDTIRIDDQQNMTLARGGEDALFMQVQVFQIQGLDNLSMGEARMMIAAIGQVISDPNLSFGADGNAYQWQEFDIGGVRDFVSTVIGESSDDAGEAQGIGSAILNNIESNTGNRNNITSGNISDLPVMYARNPPAARNADEQRQIDNRPYVNAMGYSAATLLDANNRNNAYGPRVRGALRAIQQGDNTGGSTHWEATSLLPRNPNNWRNHWHTRQEHAGALDRLQRIGATTFFRATGRPFVN